MDGKIIDFDSRKAIENVSVYIPETKDLVVSDSSGRFVFTHLSAGKYLIQFSHIGYETQFKTVEINAENISLNIEMHISVSELKEVKIVGTQIQSPNETSFNIDAISKKDIIENGSLSVSDAVSKLPGAGMISTGVGISKPVIRGLYGNRVQVNVMGVRFDNQQWQDEHGLGLGDAGINRIEVIKGAASLMYGSEALGGVINIIEEKPAPMNKTQHDFSFKLLSNTLGFGADYGFKKTTDKNWKRFRVSIENNADYSSAQNQRVLNSRFANYTMKYSTGFHRSNWVNTKNAFVSFSQMGFVFDSISYKTIDSRISRTYDGPHHRVLFGMLTNENTIYWKNNKVKINGGLISNLRQEQEGGNKISLNMLLNTFTALAQITTPLNSKADITNGISIMAQSNTNFGARIIIPDAFFFEESAFSYYKRKSKRWLTEAGVRFDLKQIKTLETGILNSPGEVIQPFLKNFSAVNGSAGLCYFLSEAFTLKANAGSGYRPGNLAELSSNGLHEGTSRWEIGNPNLKVEQNINTEIGLVFDNEKSIELSVNAFYNRFFNYIYLAPTGNEYYGFNIYQFQQSDAVLKGGEIALDLHPANVNWLDFTASYSYLEAKKSNGEFLPFIPANRINSAIKFSFREGKKISESFFKISNNFVFAQPNAAVFENTTGSYSLFNVALGGKIKTKNNQISINLTATNITDVKYVDHLSRLKYYGFYNMGRNIILNINIPINP